jgi:hypothetical protein
MPVVTLGSDMLFQKFMAADYQSREQVQAFEDGATGPVYYEGRLVRLDLKGGESSHID